MNIFDPEFSSITRSDHYRALVMSELYPDERPARIDNWSPEDREMWCGGPYAR